MGFEICALKPAAVALLTSVGKVKAVNAIVGVSMPRFASSATKSYPFMPGMAMSLTITSNRSRESIAKASSAHEAVAVRAILKAADLCATEPERAARYIVAKGYEPRYEVALEVLNSLSYNRWRTHDPEDSLRFFGLRLHEAGLINPQALIAKSTNWRFLSELKRELKA